MIEGNTNERSFLHVLELLRQRAYDQVADLLLAAHDNPGSASGAAAPGIQAARHLDLVCEQYRMAAEWYRRGYVEARHRERAIQQELIALLSAVQQPSPEGEVEPPAIVPSEGVRFGAQTVDSERLDAAVEPDELDARHHGMSTVSVYCLGAFHVYQGERMVRRWPNGKGRSIFKYLVTHRKHPVSKEVLMDLFWPSATGNAARNNLNVAIFGLRQALSRDDSESCVVFHDGCYCLNPAVALWVDYEAFREHFTAAETLAGLARWDEAIREYTIAEMLYQGDFLEDHRHEEWLAPLRQNLRDDYRRLLSRLSEYHFEASHYEACTRDCLKMLAADACDESAHQRLMLCYVKQGLPHLALRQYHLCVEALSRELDVPPSEATQQLAERIRHRRLL